jgi:hypothetical protein
MHIRFSFAAQFFEANLSKGIDLSIPLLAGDAGVNCFWAPPVEYSPVEMDGFIGSTATLRLLARGDEVVGLEAEEKSRQHGHALLQHRTLRFEKKEKTNGCSSAPPPQK